MVGPTPADWSVDPDAASVFEIRPGLKTLRLPLPWAWITHVNAYSFDRADGGITLVDCGGAGHPSAWEALLVALDRSGRQISDVRELVLTHAHSDHLGVATRIVEESGCTMWMHPAHQAFTDGALEPERIYAARERRALAEGVPPGRRARLRRHRRGARRRALAAPSFLGAPRRHHVRLDARLVASRRDAGPHPVPRVPLPRRRPAPRRRRPRLQDLRALVRLRLLARSGGRVRRLARPRRPPRRRPGAARPRAPDRRPGRRRRVAPATSWTSASSELQPRSRRSPGRPTTSGAASSARSTTPTRPSPGCSRRCRTSSTFARTVGSSARRGTTAPSSTPSPSAGAAARRRRPSPCRRPRRSAG